MPAGFTPDAPPSGFTPDAPAASEGFTPDAAPAGFTPDAAPAAPKYTAPPIPHVSYAGVKPEVVPTNTDPRNGKYAWNEHLGGFTDAPYVMANAMMIDGIEGKGHTHRDAAAHMLVSNPGAAGAMYGLNSPTVLQAMKKSKNPLDSGYANFLLDHPNTAGAITYLGEWLNPMGWVEGGMLGRGVGMVLRSPIAKPATDAVTKTAMKMVSAYGPILAAPGHGPGVRNIMAVAGQKMALAENRGHQIMMDVFGGHTYEQQVEIIRRQQGLAPKTIAGVSDKVLNAKAARLHNETLEMTRQKLINGTIKGDQVYGVKTTTLGNMAQTLRDDNGNIVGKFDYNPGTYHGIAHHFDHPNPAHNEMLKTLQKKFRSSTTTSTHKLSPGHPDIDAAMNDPLFNHEEHDPAEAVRSFFSTGYKKLEFENSLRDIAAKFPAAIFIPKTEAERQAWIKGSPALALGGQYISLREKMSAIDVKHASPTMYNMLISKPMHDFFSNSSIFDTMLGKLDLKSTSDMGKFWGSYNSAMRSLIVANPGFHPFWNIATNTAGAMGRARTQETLDKGNYGQLPIDQIKSVGDSMQMYFRAMAGTGASIMDAVGGKVESPSMQWGAKVLDSARTGLENRMLRSMKAYHAGVELAKQAGIAAEKQDAHALAGMRDEAKIAGAEFGRRSTAFQNMPAGLERGSTTGRMYTQPKLGRDPATGKLLRTQDGFRDYLDQHLTAINDWNREATFGPRGEQGFSVTLYHYLKEKLALSEEAASWATREALGNYRNVDPNSWASKAIFFYPWLKTDVALWFKILTGSPQFINAATMGARDQREVAGDPSAYNASYANPSIRLYDKPDASGTGHTTTLPLPINAPLKIGQSIFDLFVPSAPGGISEGISGLEQEATSRMKPGVGSLWDVSQTAGDPKGTEPGTFQGTHTTAFDNRAPGGQQQIDALKYVAIDMMPTLFPFVAKDILQHGFDTTKMGEYIQQAAGLGYVSDHVATSFQALMRKQDQQLQASMAPLNAAKAHGAMSAYEYAERAKFIYGLYAEKRRALRERITQLRANAGDTSGFVPDNAPGGFVPDVHPL